MNEKQTTVIRGVMTILSILFLVGVGYYGSNKRTDEVKEIPSKTIEIKEKEIATEVVKEVNTPETKVEVVGDKPHSILTSKYHTYTKEYAIDARQRAEKQVYSAQAGKVVAVLVSNGQVVKAGQVLYEIEVGSLGLTKKERDKVQDKQKALLRELELAEVKLQKLARRDSIAFVKQYVLVDEIRARLNSTTAQLDDAVNKYSRQVVNATADGVVNNLNLKVGDQLTVDLNKPLFSLVNYSLYVRIPKEDRVQWLRDLNRNQGNALVCSVEIRNSQNVSVQLNLESEETVLGSSALFHGGMFFDQAGALTGKLVVSVIYKDVYEVANAAVGLSAEGKPQVIVLHNNGETARKPIEVIRKYANYMVVTAPNLEGVAILTTYQ